MPEAEEEKGGACLIHRHARNPEGLIDVDGLLLSRECSCVSCHGLSCPREWSGQTEERNGARNGRGRGRRQQEGRWGGGEEGGEISFGGRSRLEDARAIAGRQDGGYCRPGNRRDGGQGRGGDATDRGREAIGGGGWSVWGLEVWRFTGRFRKTVVDGAAMVEGLMNVEEG